MTRQEQAIQPDLHNSDSIGWTSKMDGSSDPEESIDPKPGYTTYYA